MKPYDKIQFICVKFKQIHVPCLINGSHVLQNEICTVCTVVQRNRCEKIQRYVLSISRVSIIQMIQYSNSLFHITVYCVIVLLTDTAKYMGNDLNNACVAATKNVSIHLFQPC